MITNNTKNGQAYNTESIPYDYFQKHLLDAHLPPLIKNDHKLRIPTALCFHFLATLARK